LKSGQKFTKLSRKEWHDNLVGWFWLIFFTGVALILTSRLADSYRVEVGIDSAPVKINFVGDIMMSRYVGTQIAKSGDNTWPFLEVAEILSKADFTIGNLEAPFYDDAREVRQGLVFEVKPEYVEGLRLAGFDFLSLANNHFNDHGTDGMEFTFGHLLSNDIKYFGAGHNEQEAYEPVIFSKNGVKFAVVGFTDISAGYTRALAFKPGTAPLTEERLGWSITERAVNQEGADVVIAFPHWGNEYQSEPTARQREMAHAMIDAGADLVVGAHPHVVQPIEHYNGGLIIYGLGNFVFDQGFIRETNQGVIARVSFSRNGVVGAEFLPIHIYNFGQPRLAEGDEVAEILDQLRLPSMEG